MSKRLNGDTLPGASVGFVGEEIVAVRNDLCDHLGYQVRAPRAAICKPGQSVECWLVGGGEAPGADGVTAYEAVLLSDREAALLEQQDGTPVGMRGVPWAVEQPAAAGAGFQPEPSRAKFLTCGESEEGQIDPTTIAFPY